MRKTLFFLLMLLVLAIAGAYGYSWLRDNKLPNFRQQAEIYVYPDADADKVLPYVGEYSNYIGTSELTPDQLRQLFL